MAEETPKRGSRRRIWRWAAVGIVLLAVMVSAVLYLRSAAFADLVRNRLVAAIEDATGGHVEIASFTWNLRELAFEADNLTIHGLEPAGDLPYAHVDRALVRLHIISFFGRQYSLERLELQRPVVHLIVNADGTTNAPQPKVKRGKVAVQDLFDLAIARADLRDGMAEVNDRKLPLDFAANDVRLEMSLVPADRASEYRGRLQVGKIDLHYADYRDVPATADVQFSLFNNQLKIHSLDLVSQQSKLHAAGELSNFNQPSLQLTYTTQLDVTQLGAVTRSPQLRSGTISLDGSGMYSEASSYSTTGRIAFRGMDYIDGTLAVRKASGDANYQLAQDRLTLNKITGRLLGGEVTGEAEVKNVLAGTPPPSAVLSQTSTGCAAVPAAGSKPQKRAEQKPNTECQTSDREGSARLRVSRFSLSELTRMISTRSLPLEKLRAVGSISGRVNLDWRRSLAEGTADLALDVAAPERPAPGDMPVSGNLRGRYGIRSERLELAVLDLTTPHSHIEATGSLGTTTAMLNVKATTTSLAELLAFAPTNAVPLELSGEAGFAGTVRGRLRSPEIAGHLQATDLTYLYTSPPPQPPAPAKAAATPKKHWYRLASRAEPPAASQTPPPSKPRRIHFDSLTGDIHYTQSAASLQHATIQEGSAHLALDGSVGLYQGALLPDSSFQLHATLKNGDIEELQNAAGLSYPVRGDVTFTVQAGGTLDNPHGQGQVSLAHGEAYGRPISELTSNVQFANHAVQLENLHLQAARGSLAGSLAYDFRSKAGRFDLKGKSIDLEEIHEVQLDRLAVAGQANFTAQGSGTWEHPVVNAHVEVANLSLNEQAIGSVVADAVTEGRRLTLTARSHFPNGNLTLDGNAELEGEMPAIAILHFTNLDVNPFLPANMRKQVTRHASLHGQMQLNGPLRQPRRLNGTLNLQEFSVELQHLLVHSEGPVQLSFADEVLRVERCVIVSDQTRFTLTGTAGLTAEHPLELQANGMLDLRLAQSFNPDLTAYGTSNISLRVRGTASHPVLDGQVQVAQVGVSLIDMPVGLSELNGTLLFTQDRLQIQTLTGRMGGGHVSLSGFVTFANGLGFNLSLDGNDVRLRYAGISATSDQALRLTGSMQNANVAGNITITRFAQIPSADLQGLFSQAGAPTIPNPKSPLNNVHLEVRILSTPELTVETSLAKLSGDVDLRLRGTAAHPVLLGRIAIAEGDVRLAGTKYHLERGDVTFINPVRIDPVLDVEATTRVRDYDITIGLHGTIERLNTTYRSDPPLTTDDIISLLAFGRTQTENALGTGGANPGFAESASGALLTSALNQAVGNRVSKIFGYSTIRINPSLGGPENDPNARLTLEQQVSKDITFTYITNLARSAQEVIQFEYNINSEYTLQGIRDENGVVSFDLLIRKRRP
jgi:translocation and assembly module TamB